MFDWRKQGGKLIGVILLGFIGGVVASYLRFPMPFLLGSLLVTAIFTIAYANPGKWNLRFPDILRKVFIAIIGAMIGAGFSPDLVGILPTLWISMLAMLPFVVICHVAIYHLFRGIAAYDRKTAFYASMPGGLIESITMWEEAGCDPKLLTAQQFLRIILVVLTIPLLFTLWIGESVGSAAGMTLAAENYAFSDVAIILGLAMVGLIAGTVMRFPAPHMMGPLLMSAIFHGSGTIEIANPAWLLNLAQLIVGCGLGLKFNGIQLNVLIKALGVGILSVAIMLFIGLGFAFGLAMLSPINGSALFLSFAPGGITEMGLVALSLNASAVVVAAHHLVRILITVSLVGVASRFLPWIRKDG